jgi:hypothetical protein
MVFKGFVISDEAVELDTLVGVSGLTTGFSDDAFELGAIF